jgi:lipopolysaccharide cholinephosphotransferase
VERPLVRLFKPFDELVVDSKVILYFENKTFFAIAEYDVYLEQHYKNYMKLPPKDKQINHQTTAWWVI